MTLTLTVDRRDHLGDLDHERAHAYTRDTATVETMTLHGKVRAEFDKPTTRNKAGDSGSLGLNAVPNVRDGGAGADNVLSVLQELSPEGGSGSPRGCTGEHREKNCASSGVPDGGTTVRARLRLPSAPSRCRSARCRSGHSLLLAPIPLRPRASLQTRRGAPLSS